MKHTDSRFAVVVAALVLFAPTLAHASDAWRKLLVCYDSDTTGGTDANIVPVRAYDLLINGAAVVPNGNNINVDFSSGYLVVR